MLRRPSSALGAVRAEPRRHALLSAALFASACAVGLAGQEGVGDLAPAGAGPGWEAAMRAAVLAGAALANLSALAAVHLACGAWAGVRRRGGFAATFAVMSHCLLPLVAGTALVLLASHALPGCPGASGGPDYAVDFAGGAAFTCAALRWVAFAPFAAWTAALMVKGAGVLGGFGTARSVAAVALSVAAWYASAIAFGIASAIAFDIASGAPAPPRPA